MIVVAWLLVGLWGLVLLSSARPGPVGLPTPTEVVPPYTLWLPEGGEAPPLEPPPTQVLRGPTPPVDGPQRVLVLGGGVEVPPDLPGRLAACGADFVSVLPTPRGGVAALAVERWRRDFAGAPAVADPRNPAGFADRRCAWLRRVDLALPGVGVEPVLRAARARKAHGLTVDLRDGRAAGGGRVSAPAFGWRAHREDFADLVAPDPVVALLVRGLPPLMTLTPLLLLAAPGTRAPALLALGLGSGARLMSAVRDGFGHALAVAGWALEPALALWTLGAARDPTERALPTPPRTAPPGLTGPATATGGAWLEAAAVPFLARRLGGASRVMEQVYRNHPAGRSALGRAIDRAVHVAPASRAVRHRWVATVELARALGPEALLSVPCGSARDAAAVGAPRTVLADPDPDARMQAKARCPEAEVVNATVEQCPAGPFDLVLYVGLSEYLDDAEVVRHLNALRGRLRPDGALLTTCTAEHPQRAQMGRWLGWRTRARTPDAFAALLDAAGYRVEARVADPFGIQWVFQARPRPVG